MNTDHEGTTMTVNPYPTLTAFLQKAQREEAATGGALDAEISHFLAENTPPPAVAHFAPFVYVTVEDGEVTSVEYDQGGSLSAVYRGNVEVDGDDCEEGRIAAVFLDNHKRAITDFFAGLPCGCGPIPGVLYPWGTGVPYGEDHVERCDTCQIYENDEAARDALAAHDAEVNG